MEGLSQPLHPKDTHNFLYYKKNTKALREYNKDQISETTILTTLDIPTRPIKGVTMDRAHCPWPPTSDLMNVVMISWWSPRAHSQTKHRAHARARVGLET
jgi:hypothetical protein